MKIAPRFRGKIENGKLKITDESGFNKYLTTMKGEVGIVVEPYKYNRSGSQNRYYWGVVIPLIADEIGEEKDVTHDILKARFLKYKKTIKSKRTGQEKTMTVVGSTTKMTTVEFMEYTETVKRWASIHLNIFIPDPGDVSFD